MSDQKPNPTEAFRHLRETIGHLFDDIDDVDAWVAEQRGGEMARNAWKHTERAVAKRLNGKRNGNRGTATADVENDWCAAEIKHRKQLPAWLHSAMRQAVNAAQPGQLPIVVLHQLHQRSDDDFVVLRMADFVDFFGDVEQEDV